MGLLNSLDGYNLIVVCGSCLIYSVIPFWSPACLNTSVLCVCVFVRVSFDSIPSPPDSWWFVRGQPPRLCTLLKLADEHNIPEIGNCSLVAACFRLTSLRTPLQTAAYKGL